MWRFEATLAYRHLRSGGGQTALTVSAVAAGVVVVVFLSSLIFGVQKRITDLLTDIMPHVTITPEERDPAPLTNTPNGGIISSRVERQSRKREEIRDWQQAEVVIRGIPNVQAVAPAIVGQGFVSRGSQRIGTQVFAAEPESLDAVNAVEKYMVEGHYFGLTAEELVMSYKLAKDLGVEVGDHVRLTSAEEQSDSFRVAGIYDTGQERSVGSRVFLTLRAGQSLFAAGTSVRTILVRANTLFGADAVARRIEALLPYEVDAWSDENPDIVSSLKAQQATAVMISGFSLVASSFAIAAVLIVSVLQKSKQIGILKSIGAKPRQIMVVFLLEGLGIAVVGSLLGAGLGSGLVWGLSQFKQPVTRLGAPPQSLFPAVLAPEVVAAAIGAAILATVLAAVLPARRAARLDPVEVLR